MSAIMVDIEIPVDSVAFRETEALLYAWGREREQMRRSIQRSLNTPKESSISEMIEQQRIFEGRLRGVRRPRLRLTSTRVVREYDGRKVSQCQCGMIFAGRFCPSCSPDPKVVQAAQADLDARGKSSPSTRAAPLKYGLSSRATAVNAAVNRLTRRHGDAINLAYGQELPDRVCAKLLGIPRYDFTLHRRAAVIQVATMLAGKPMPGVKSAPPIRADGDAYGPDRLAVAAKSPKAPTA